MVKNATLHAGELDIASTALLIAGFTVTFFAYKFHKSCVIGIGGTLFGLFLWNEVVPQFAHDLLVCYVVGCFVAAVGALVGGVVSLLLKWVSVGASLGSLLALWLILVDNGHFIVSETSIAIVCGASIAGCMVLSWYRTEVCMLAAFSAFGGVMLSYGLDMLLDSSLLLDTGAILQMKWPTDEHCHGDCYMPELLALWLVLTVSGFIVQGHLSGKVSVIDALKRWTAGSAYSPVPAQRKTESIHKVAYQRTFTYPDNQAFNYFPADKLPAALQQHTEVIYHTAEALANFFGFQDDNVRNQVEHVQTLIANHRRFTDAGPDIRISAGRYRRSAVHSLHSKLFENYTEWCSNLKVSPKFMSSVAEARYQDESAELQGLMCDTMLYLCIWGEAANLRHMPECLCFLYHKTMQEFLVHRHTGSDALYAGYFLDQVITPIWDVVNKHHKVKGDHIKARNYDDFNEFFWSPACLQYAYRDSDADGNSPHGSHHHLDRMLQEREAKAAQPKIIPVHKALAKAPKTFLEKRSLLSTILTFNRILEFNIVTFWALSMLSYGEMLVWDNFFKLQMLSSVFLVFNLLGLLWCILEVWQAFPGINITGTAKAGFLIRLSTRFLILVYQALYFMWSLKRDTGAESAAEDIKQEQQTALYWWWQYLWLSAVAMSTYVAECLFQLLPMLTTFLCTRDNDYLNAFLNLYFPLSRLYVGKSLHETMKNAAGYIFFWVSLLAWKLYFSYQYEVKILVLPSVELFDDFINYQNQSFWRTSALIVLFFIPQCLIYLIDTSIWYAVWSAMAGSIVGFQERLGEIRDFKSIRDAFMRIPEVFCSKVISAGVSSRDNSMVDLTAAGGSKGGSSSNALNERTALLAKSGKSADNLGSGSVRGYVAEFLDVRTQKWGFFAAVWNEVVNQMRLSDVISNAERDMLKFHSFANASKPVYLPIFQTAGCVERAIAVMVEEANAYAFEETDDTVSAAARKSVHEKSLRDRIGADITVSEAVSEAWELGALLLKTLLGPLHASDVQRFENIMNEFMGSSETMRYLKLQNLTAIIADATAIVTILYTSLPRRVVRPKDPKVGSSPQQQQQMTRQGSGNSSMKRAVSTSGLSDMSHSIPLADDRQTSDPRRKNMLPRNAAVENAAAIPDKTRDQVRDKLRPLIHSLRGMIKRTIGDTRPAELQDLLALVLSLEQGFMWDDKYATGRLDTMAGDPNTLSVLSKIYGLLATQVSEAEPTSAEARRRLAFFVNSLFMDMPRAPPVSTMLSWSCMTPYYSEDVLYGRGDLEKRNEDGLSTLMYLQALYKHDWHNFLERLNIQDEQQIWSKRFFQQTRLWASLRAQTLSRTVEGMMYYEAALRLLAHIEKMPAEQIENVVKQKFQYVVACQVFGRMKKNQDSKADDIERLLKRFPNLRIAYIDEVRVTREGQNEYFSVLIKTAEDGQSIEEVYRVKLPGNPVIGEGKPENQNHAIIFTRGEHVQAIDMNQEGYFEEALKMRCLLQEFVDEKNPKTTIVGFREHIFTGSISSLANYMALQELSFVTLGQRVLNKPLRARMHYGHPDLFDKVFFMTRGGISKASKGINLSEDIFAGYNNAIRGGQVQFKEYAQVGKGRDVGMQQIYKFEAKLAQGAAEQSLSRDTNRLGGRLDFFRLTSFYFGGLGYYVGNFITVATIVFVVYFMLALAVFNAEQIGERKITPTGTLQMLLAGMGILNTLPMLATLMVEKGLRASLMTVSQVFVSGGPLYFMFHIQTRAHYFYQTLLAGGAQYRATGRGFVTHHSTFDDLYRFFATSHFYLGFELMVALIVMLFTTQATQYFGRTWSLWLACVSFLFAPFWFNPLTFEWTKVVDDYNKWMRWMIGTGGSSSNSWEVWWREENGYLSKFGLGQKLQCMIKPVFYLVIGVGIGLPKVLSMEYMKPKDARLLFRCSLLAVFLLSALYLFERVGHKFQPWLRRSGKLILSVLVFCGAVAVVVAHYEYIRVAIGLYYITAALSSMGVLLGFSTMRHAHHLHDFILGHILFAVLLLMAALQLPKDIQTWLLFHNALSQGVVIEDILKYARKSQEQSAGSEDAALEDSTELKRVLAQQKALLQKMIEDGAQMHTAGMGNGGAHYGNGEVAISVPLHDGNDSDVDVAQVEKAGMMKASKSTLDFSVLAHSKPRRQSQETAQQKGKKDDKFEFSTPTSFPPRN